MTLLNKLFTLLFLLIYQMAYSQEIKIKCRINQTVYEELYGFHEEILDSADTIKFSITPSTDNLIFDTLYLHINLDEVYNNQNQSQNTGSVSRAMSINEEIKIALFKSASCIEIPLSEYAFVDPKELYGKKIESEKVSKNLLKTDKIRISLTRIISLDNDFKMDVSDYNYQFIIE